jgi:DNA mismatch repair protein MutS
VLLETSAASGIRRSAPPFTDHQGQPARSSTGIRQTTAGGERYYTEELKTYEEQISSADDLRIERERELFQKVVRQVAAVAKGLMRLSHAIATADVLASLAYVAERRGYCRPEVDGGDRIEIGDGRHPVIERLAEGLGEAFVPNDLEIGDGERLMIITGPNMAGKSTIMRQTALLVLLAQMGSFVPAKRARVGLVDRIFTRVGASDDLSRGRSTFMVEMSETARILRAATRRSLILLDEIGRGTSTFDGLSIAWAVAEHIHDVIGAKTLFATHYHELTEICRDKPHARNFHVEVKEWKDRIVFLRKLVAGPTNRSYGVQVGPEASGGSSPGRARLARGAEPARGSGPQRPRWAAAPLRGQDPDRRFGPAPSGSHQRGAARARSGRAEPPPGLRPTPAVAGQAARVGRL